MAYFLTLIQLLIEYYLLLVWQLLKVQAKYLGRNWRKSNMKTMSAIYQRVGHRLCDDWAFGNGMEHNTISCVVPRDMAAICVVITGFLVTNGGGCRICNSLF